MSLSTSQLAHLVSSHEEVTLKAWTQALMGATSGATLGDIMSAWLQRRARVPHASAMYHMLTAALLCVTMAGAKHFGAPSHKIEDLKRQAIDAWNLAKGM